MREIFGRRLGMWLAVPIVLAGCSRSPGHKEENSRSSIQAPASPSIPVSNLQAGTAAQPADASVPEWRPSPFVRPQLPVSKQEEPLPGEHSPAAVRTTRPFQMPAQLAATTGSRIASPTLASPPALAPAASDAGQLLILPEGTCCAGTATYEPARRNGFQRLIHDVPGLRRLDQSGASGKGFVPARPLRDIQISLPPDSSAALMRNMRMDLQVTVDASGRVTRVELLSPKDEDLATLAAYGASEWRFAPAKSNDRPVASEVILHFRFDRQSVAQAATDKPERH
jgi:outer membrane biosynthesis protein TonB